MMTFPIYGKIKNVPNHQPVIIFPDLFSYNDHPRKTTTRSPVTHHTSDHHLCRILVVGWRRRCFHPFMMTRCKSHWVLFLASKTELRWAFMYILCTYISIYIYVYIKMYICVYMYRFYIGICIHVKCVIMCIYINTYYITYIHIWI